MTFREMVQKDIKNVFLNPKEFGETHVIDGKEMTIIIDDNELLERKKGKTIAIAEGLHTRQLLIYVSIEDFGEEPLIGRLLELDGNDYTVLDVTNEMGMYTITLEVNES